LVPFVGELLGPSSKQFLFTDVDYHSNW